MLRYSTKSPPLPSIPARDVPKPQDYDDAIYGPCLETLLGALHCNTKSTLLSTTKSGGWNARIPRGALVLPCKIVCKVKPDGCEPPGIDKFKMRYCGKGYMQRRGVHYICVHAPIASAVTTRIIIAIGTELDWPIHDMDVRNVYLNTPLNERIVLFVKPPPTIVLPKGYGLRLLKALYGTMQGGNRWTVHKHAKL